MNISNKRKVWITITCLLPPILFVIFMLAITPALVNPPRLRNYESFVNTLPLHLIESIVILLFIGILFARWCIVKENIGNKRESILIWGIWASVLVSLGILGIYCIFAGYF